MRDTYGTAQMQLDTHGQNIRTCFFVRVPAPKCTCMDTHACHRIAVMGSPSSDLHPGLFTLYLHAYL